MANISLEDAQAAKQQVARRLEGVAQVVGIGITRVDGRYAVKVNLNSPLSTRVVLPESIDGVPIRVEVVGNIRPRG